MSTTLRIKWIQIKDHRGWQEPYCLDGRLIAVIGPIDRGKSSMVDCIDFLFGRTVHFKGAVDRCMRSVRSEVELGGSTFTLERARRSESVYVKDSAGDEQGTFSIAPKGEQQNLSSWLLEQIGLDDEFSSVRLPQGRSLGFAADLIPYLRIRQEDIDRFIIRPTSKADEDARRTTLKLLPR